jgi:flagellar hook-associated protein 2
MAGIDYINALGAGASFDTKSIVEALVQAERAGAESQIQRKVAVTESKISGIGAAVSILDILKQGAELLNDARDFNTFSVQNTSAGAVNATASTSARAGTNSVAVTSLAKEQRSISSGFDSNIQTLNNNNAIQIDITVDGSTQTLTVESANLDAIATAINEANLGLNAEIVNTGSGSSSYRLQLVGEAGSSESFSVSSDFNELTFETIQTATDAELTVNGVNFIRSSNQISDIIQGVTLNLIGTTDQTETISISRDTSLAKGNIMSFIAMFNEASSEFKNLTGSENDGPLRGDTIFRSIVNQLRSIMVSESSSPGENINSLSSMGISIDRYGQLLYDEGKIDAALNKNYDEVIGLFSANINDQSRFSSDPAGIAGDIKNLIERVTASDGYLSTAQASLTESNAGYEQDLKDIDERMIKVEERYNRQFLAMQTIIEEMNSTKESLIASFENLPFSNKND